ncbi:DUF3653 domain-containing protein [Methylophilus glucosoxydans]|uniref:DUF3653 domain-containing protein n=1 Tax=Methylophilus glucosoxydans TaxID=752553 RepID=A0ABW3GJL4_9PROT
MNKKSDIKKLQSKNTIEWYLTVGWHFGTITTPYKAREILQVDRVTWYRWITGKAAAPYSALELLRLHAFGEPPCGRSIAWRGFRFQNEKLIAEDGREFSPADLKAVFYWKQMAFDKLDNEGLKEIYQELKQIYRHA